VPWAGAAGDAVPTAAATSLPAAPGPPALTTFANDGAYDELVYVTGIGFTAFCGEEGLPVGGLAHVAYMPGARLVGLSKLARLVEHVSQGSASIPHLARSLVDALDERLRPRGAGVVVEAAQVGPAAGPPTGRWVVSAWAGCLRHDAATRAAFRSIVRAHRRHRGGR
jgi:GTP cyclohydrolase I